MHNSKNVVVAVILVLAVVRLYLKYKRKQGFAAQASAPAAESGQAAALIGSPVTSRQAGTPLRNIWLIGRREFIERVKSKAFVIMTLLVPGAMIIGGYVSYLSATHLGSNQSITIASNDASLAQDVRTELLSSKSSGDMHVNVVSLITPAVTQQLIQQVDSKQLDGYVLLDPPMAGAPPKITYASRTSADISGASRIEDAVSSGLLHERLLEKGISTGDIDSITKKIDVTTVQIKNGAAVESNSTQSFLVADLMMFLLYFSVTYYAMNMARSVVQEKTSRIFEVMLATVTPEESMAGKLLGVGGAGLTQIAIWLTVGALLVATPIATQIGMHDMHITVRLSQLGLFVVYFVLGFLLYSSVAAMLGAVVGAEQEVQQFAFPLILPMFIVLVSYVYILGAPNSTYAVTLSLFPFTAPLAMILRVASQTPPGWQITLSIAIMMVTIWLTLKLAARIYRVGILMYGKRPTVPEIFRWIRFA